LQKYENSYVASPLRVFNAAGQIESGAFPGRCASISSPADTTPGDAFEVSDQSEQRAANPGVPVIAYHCIADVTDEQWDGVP
jgi:hypothetical protein